ncbi:ABC transporter permease [Thiohalomonas denitrificans]|uniref:ABC transporter permease n=1 Tax=Thiohalomonas denitrificans TaxID=415747 RepID=UPI0026ECE55F|nr:ABC transporter permease subunit [Thiohalomonas denitrificans]
MKHLWLTAYTDVLESLRARWFMVYALVFGGIVVVLFAFGLTESRIMGFSGLSRLLITYIQLTMAILPVFVLITTVRSVAGDREAGVFEYLLSLPVTLAAWFWGKMIGRFLVVFLPVLVAMMGAIAWAVVVKGAEVPWATVSYYTGLLVALAWCFLGIGMLISTLARSADVAQGAAFVVWLTLLLFLDLILLGIMIREHLPPETAVAISLINPMQVFRTATMLLFDPQLVLLGPAAYIILDNFGNAGYIAYAVLYPTLLGTLCAALGFFFFRRSDLP